MKLTDCPGFLGLLGLVLWVFRKSIFEGCVLYKRDIHLVWYPQAESFVRSVAAGSWPVWDPFPAGGQPLLADASAQVAYPFTWLNLVLHPWTYYTLFAASHALFSGAGLYVLARHWKMSRSAAFVAAGLWMLSGPFLSLVGLWHHLASAAWIPWVVLTADAALETPRPRNGLLWGLAMAGQILGGSADMSAMTALFVGGQALVRNVRWRKPFCSDNRCLIAMAAGAFGLAAGLAAVLWLPALDVARQSARWGLPAETRTYWSLHPLSVVETVLPVLLPGLPLKGSLVSAMFGGREPFLTSLYLGAPALVLVAAGLVFSSASRKRFLAAAGVLALLMALGRHTPVYGLLVAALPPLQILRYPVKAMVIVALCWALLAGFGLDACGRQDSPHLRRSLLAALAPGAALACVAVAGAWTTLHASVDWRPFLIEASQGPGLDPLARAAGRLMLAAALATLASLLALSGLRARAAPLLGLGFAVLVLGDLARLHRYIEPVAPRALFTNRPEVLETLKDADHPRVYVYDYSQPGKSLRYLKRDGRPVLVRAPEGWDLEAASALAMQMSLTPMAAGRWGLDSGFEIDYRGLFPWKLEQLSRLLRHLEGTPGHLRLLRLGSITHVVAFHEEGFEDLVPSAVIPSLYQPPLRVFRVPGTLPRTYVVGGVRVADGPEAFGALVDPAFEPSRELVLPAGSSRPAPPLSPGISTIIERGADRVRIAADLRQEGYVVLLDSYDPGWRVSVDGRAGRLLRANVMYRAVHAPAGRHLIEFVYRPRAVILGLILTSLSAAAALIAARRLSSSRREP